MLDDSVSYTSSPVGERRERVDMRFYEVHMQPYLYPFRERFFLYKECN